MAYRFLLEVPGTLAAEAQTAVDSTPDAQVILVRDSHGLGFEDPFVDLTVAAHSLSVIDAIYDWFDRLGASRPDIRLVLHSGERVTLEAIDRGEMVATIRRDQPWVERSLPKVGEHEEDVFLGGEREGDLAIDAAVGNAPVAVGHRRDAAETEVGRRVHLRSLNHIAVSVNNPAKAEQFYQQFLNFDLLGRARNSAAGLEPVEHDYDWDEATRAGRQANVSFLANGPVTLAVHNAGRSARIDEGVVDHISVTVDAGSFAAIRGEALVRPLTLSAISDTSFRFRDPFGLVWEITLANAAGRVG